MMWSSRKVVLDSYSRVNLYAKRIQTWVNATTKVYKLIFRVIWQERTWITRRNLERFKRIPIYRGT